MIRIYNHILSIRWYELQKNKPSTANLVGEGELVLIRSGATTLVLTGTPEGFTEEAVQPMIVNFFKDTADNSFGSAVVGVQPQTTNPTVIEKNLESLATANFFRLLYHHSMISIIVCTTPIKLTISLLNTTSHAIFVFIFLGLKVARCFLDN